VIRDDDLKLLEKLGDALKAAAAAGFFSAVLSAPQLATAGVGLLVAAAQLVRQAMKKGARLEPFDFRVLWLLKANAPAGLTTDEIVAVLRRTELVEPAAVEAALARLASHVVADGSTAAFASRDAAGRWRAAGV
jgi:hypothetical protein